MVLEVPLTVGDDVHASEVLAGHEQQTDTDAVAYAVLEEALKHFAKLHPVGRALLDLLANLGQLVADVLAVAGELAQVDEDRLGVLPAVLAGEPAGGLGAEEHAEAEEGAGDELEA